MAIASGYTPLHIQLHLQWQLPNSSHWQLIDHLLSVPIITATVPLVTITDSGSIYMLLPSSTFHRHASVWSPNRPLKLSLHLLCSTWARLVLINQQQSHLIISVPELRQPDLHYHRRHRSFRHFYKRFSCNSLVMQISSLLLMILCTSPSLQHWNSYTIQTHPSWLYENSQNFIISFIHSLFQWQRALLHPCLVSANYHIWIFSRFSI